MHSLDRTTAKALAEAGYLPTSAYVAMFGNDGHESALLVPDLCDDPHDAVVLEQHRASSQHSAQVFPLGAV